MANFRVTLDFSAVVSEEAADELEYFVREFVQGVLNIVANDEYDQVAATIANTVPVEYHVNSVPAELPEHCGNVLHVVEDEGSDAPISAVNFEDDGPTDFDRR